MKKRFGVTLIEIIVAIIIILVVLTTFGVGLSGCFNAQFMAKSFGGSYEIKLPPNAHLVNADWDQSHLWLLTRQRRPDEKLETWTYHESSTWGIMQGTVTIQETDGR